MQILVSSVFLYVCPVICNDNQASTKPWDSATQTEDNIFMLLMLSSEIIKVKLGFVLSIGIGKSGF